MSLALLRHAVRAIVDVHPAVTSAKKRAACVLVQHAGQVLAVSRKHDSTAMGLPGGKMDDEDEDERAAAARELAEETGLRVDPRDLRPVFTHSADEQYTTTTFEVDWHDCAGPIRTTEAGRVRWVSWDELLAGPFGRYNAMLMAELGIA